MKKVLVLLLTLTLTLSLSFSAFAGSDKGNNGHGNGNGKNKSETQAAVADSKALMKQFKQEMNQAIKGLTTLETDRLTLAASLEEMKANPLAPEATEEEIAAYDAAVKALEDQIAEIDGMLANPAAANKQLINERFMVIKSIKSGFTLSEYDSAEALIAAMYTAAQDTEAWSIWTNQSGSLIKLEGPMYLKGGKIMFPVKALENMGATVIPDLENKTVTITGANGMSIVFGYNGTTASTQASAELGTAPSTFSWLFDDAAATSGPASIDGTIPCTVTNPLTGELITVELTFEATSENISTDPVLLTTDGAISGTISGDIIDPDTLEVLGTVTGTVGGSLLIPEFELDSDTTALAVPFESEINCGRAYVPLQDLAAAFDLDVFADTTEGTVTVETPEPVSETVVE